MIEFKGTIIEGEKSASGFSKNWNGKGPIYHQVEFIKSIAPSFYNEIKKCKFATINILLEKDIVIKKWEYIFDKVFWLPTSDTWYEKISFTPVLFHFQDQNIKAWLYKPYKSPHKNRKNFFEIISPEVNNIKYNEACKIKINKSYIYQSLEEN